MRDSFLNIFTNVYIITPFCAWMLAQLIKMLLNFIKTKRINYSYLMSTGGMPSAHSALVSGLATITGINVGFGSPIFAVALGFALITMFDASTVRRAAGTQARLINEMVEELFKEHRFSEQKLAELLGHTRFEVFMGMTTGILVAIQLSTLSCFPANTI
ncbi:MAG: divergent PAP2 family protein [Kiritimatiellae bacterium]|nr:divergent PAP2 family protein [Kiritimatiellia bacterium]